MRELSELESDSEPTSYSNISYKSNFGRSVASLFKKSFLIKIRRPAAIIELILALVIWIIIYPCWLLARDKNKGYPNPTLYQTNLIPYRLVSFFAVTRNSTFVIAPDCNNTRVLASMINYTINTAIDLFFLSLNANTTEINNTDDWVSDIIDQLYPEFNEWLNQTLNGTLGPNISFSDINFTDLFLNFTSSNNITLDDILNNLFNRTLLPTPNPAVLLDYDETESKINQKSIQKLIDSEFIDYIKISFNDGLKEYFSDYPDDSNPQNVRSFLKDYLVDKTNEYLLFLSNRYRQSIINYNKIDELSPKNNRKVLSKKINSLYETKNKRQNNQNLNQTNFNTNRKIIRVDDDNFGGNNGQGNDNDDDENEDSSNIDYGQYVNLTEIRAQFEFEPVFVDTVDEITDRIYEHTSNGVGVYWANAEDNETALTSPIIQTYSQVFFSSPDRDLLEIIYRSIAIMSGYPEALLSIARTSYQYFATPETEELFDLSILIGIIAIFPIILSTMPDMQSLLEEKDTRVQTLSFLMGCTETAYFFVEFSMCFIVSFFPYLFMCLFLCYGFVMVGTSFSLMFVLSLLFIIAHICFLMFITTFMKKASMGRIITVVFLVLTVFFSYIHYFYTLDSSNNEEAVKHVFSIIPLSCYQMVLMTMYSRSRTSLPAVDWSMIKNDDEFVYPIWYALLWLPIDIVLYFLLFLLFNLTNSREFGAPLISWKELFNKDAWKRLFKKDYSRYRKSSVSGIDQNSLNQLMRVEDLSKTYNGYKEVKALTDVNFTIYQNEVIVVIGPNGAGKSTLINILAGAIEPTSGTLYLYGGEPTKRFTEIQKFLGVCFQDNVILNLLSIKEHFDLFGSFKNIPKQELEETMNFYAETLQLTDMLKTRAGDLSGGQKRKLCISLSLLGNPPLVIMDEPTAGVDVQARQLIWKVIASLKHTTTIVTSHALEEAEAVSSRLFVVAGGKVPFAGTSTEFRKQFQCGYILRIDTSNANVEEEEEEERRDRDHNQNQNNNYHHNINNANNLSNESSNHSNLSENNNNNNNDNNNNSNNNDNGDELALKINEDSNSLESNYLDDNDVDDPLPFNVDVVDKNQQKVVDQEVMAKVFQLAKKYEEQSKMSEDRDDTILMPVSKNIPKFINKFEELKKKLGVTSYSFSVEQLEDVLLKLIQMEEAANENRH